MEIEEEPEPNGDDGETIESDDTESQAAGNPDTQTALSIMQIENMINSQIEEIDKTRDDVKMLKSSFEDAFKNDAKYREFDEKVKEVAKLKKQYVDAMKKDASIQKAEQDFINRRDELKDLQMGLSDYLKEYNRVSGLSQFETQDGQLLKIVQTFKLVKG
jgi:Mg2+ and Co2+ transporter CorA